MLQQDIDHLVKWSNDWLMTFNNEKFKFMAIKTSPKKGYIQLNFTMNTHTKRNKTGKRPRYPHQQQLKIE